MRKTGRTKAEPVQEIEPLNSRIESLERDDHVNSELIGMWRRYEFIVNTSKDFMTMIDPGYRYVAVNDAYCRAHGKRQEDILNRKVSEIWGEEVFLREIKSCLDECFGGQEIHYQARFHLPAIGVREMDVTYYPFRDAGGRVAQVVVVSRDVTEARMAEQQLLSLKKAVETMQLGVTITNIDGDILFTNPAEAAMHGYSRDELLNSKARVFSPQQFWRERSVESLKEIRSWRREGINIRRNGDPFPVQLMSDVVKNQAGEPFCIVTTCEDITERKRAEKQIRQQMQRMTILREIDTAILSSIDLRVTLNVLLNHLLNHLEIDAALIMTLDPHTLAMEYAESKGFRSPAVRNLHMKIGEGLSGKIAYERRPLMINNIDEDPAVRSVADLFVGEDFSAYYGLPLISKGYVIGTLEVFKRGGTEFQPDSQDFLEALEAQAAIAIDNARMFSDLYRKNIELTLAYDTTLDGWSRALDLRDKETEGHSQRVTELTMKIAGAMDFSESEMVQIRRGAMLHDIGKLGIPDCILLKPSPLNDEEWEIMKKHPVYAYEMLSPIHFLRPALDIPYCHHEKWDGGGYPRGLKGEHIPLAARIFTIADVWDALCSDRAYRPAYSKNTALDYIGSLENKDFDPDVLRVFMKLYK